MARPKLKKSEKKSQIQVCVENKIIAKVGGKKKMQSTILKFVKTLEDEQTNFLKL